MSTFIERLRMLIGDESALGFSKRCGLKSESSIRGYLAGRLPGLEAAAQICTATGVSMLWLATGEGPMRIDPQVLPAPKGMAPIPMLDEALVECWANNNENKNVSGVTWFDEAWLNHHWKVRSSDLALFRVTGESMEPTLRTDDWVMVCRYTRENPPVDGMYVVTVSGGLMVKRIQYLNGSIRVSGDHPSYQPIDLPMDIEARLFTIVGRVLVNMRTL